MNDIEMLMGKPCEDKFKKKHIRIPGVFSENYWHNKKTSKGEPGECNFGEIHSSLISAISPLWERER